MAAQDDLHRLFEDVRQYAAPLRLETTVCNLADVCVMVKAGQMSSLRSNDNSSPLNPTQATLDELTTAVNATNLPDKPNGLLRAGTHGISKPWGIALGAIAVGVAIAVPVAITKNTNNPVAPTKPPCPPSQCG